MPQKNGSNRGRTPAGTARNPSNGGRPRPRRKRNYPAGSPAAVKRQKRIRRRVAALLITLLLIVLAVLFSTDILFKLESIKIENPTRTEPVDTGIYTELDIAQASQLTPGAPLFSISCSDLEKLLLVSLPYLETVKVRYSLPTTILIQITPAVESLYMEVEGKYLILSETLRVLAVTDQAPEGLIQLRADLTGEAQVGHSLDETLVTQEDEEKASQAQAENQTLANALAQLTQYLHQESLYDRVTRIDLTQMENVSVILNEKITLQLGTLNNLDYKFQLAGQIARNENGEGLTENDVGVLDLSNSPATGKAYYTPQ